MDIRVNGGDSRLKGSNYLTLCQLTCFRHFLQYSIAICSRPETASDVISIKFVRLIVAKFRDPRLNRSQEIQHKVAVGSMIDSLS